MPSSTPALEFRSSDCCSGQHQCVYLEWETLKGWMDVHRLSSYMVFFFKPARHLDNTNTKPWPSTISSCLHLLKKIQQEQHFLIFPFLEPVTFNSSLSIVLSLSSSVFVPMETAGLSGKERITCFRCVFAVSFDLMKRTS